MDVASRKESLERFGVENLGAVHENLPLAWLLVEASHWLRESPHNAGVSEARDELKRAFPPDFEDTVR